MIIREYFKKSNKNAKLRDFAILNNADYIENQKFAVWKCPDYDTKHDDEQLAVQLNEDSSVMIGIINQECDNFMSTGIGWLNHKEIIWLSNILIVLSKYKPWKK